MMTSQIELRPLLGWVGRHESQEGPRQDTSEILSRTARKWGLGSLNKGREEIF
jgi:hypothetical protein